MPSTASSHIIFFIAAMVVSTAVVGTLISTTNTFSDDIQSFGKSLGNNLRTKIKIQNDAAAMPYNSSNNTLMLYVQNIGSTVIDVNNTTMLVLINGTAQTNLTLIVPGGLNYWKPSVMLTIVVGDVTLPADDYYLKVVAPGGAADRMDFKIT